VTITNLNRTKKFEESEGPKSPKFTKAPTKKCPLCNDTVFRGDSFFEISDLRYHQSCFKCSQCKMSLNIGNYKSYSGKIYCVRHYNDATDPMKMMDKGFKEIVVHQEEIVEEIIEEEHIQPTEEVVVN